MTENNIISIESFKIDRSKYEFVSKSITLHDECGSQRTYACIVLIDKKTKNIVCGTGYEKYVVDLSCAEVYSDNTYRYARSRVLSFLNYLLYETRINSINEVTVNEIVGFLLWSKTKKNGEEVKSSTWRRKQRAIYVFLDNFYKYNHEVVEFGYKPDELWNLTVFEEKRKWGNRKHIILECKPLNVKPPKSNDHKHRKRTIMYGHLDALLFTAKKYNPMLYLAISLMAYAGLREGEVVNLSFGDIRERRRLGVLEKITLDLFESDKFRTGKSHTGIIKKIREQEVYPDFLEKIHEAIEYHKDYLQVHGLSSEQESPIFYNKHRKAMSVTTLTSRIKELFENYFLSILKDTSNNTEFEGETYAHIEAYEDEYPGAHMFRHWFTMYLITKKKLSPELVRKWRGDSPNSNAYEEYLHLNFDLMEAYKNTAYSFQERLIGDIYE